MILAGSGSLVPLWALFYNLLLYLGFADGLTPSIGFADGLPSFSLFIGFADGSPSFSLFIGFADGLPSCSANLSLVLGLRQTYIRPSSISP
jgi:hypothetical protein